ncbi:glycosyltransferase family 4 protein [Jiella avicenniae]|uniref:Glycosyltransferase family 4 protein n=1 Tax=Jiella avicenniae TaxID=2907202 RepID=A0A9X1P454_9HYPH|nr:glycosyltransferase family 4 protein [Jiella avicenniae]MCE7028956.1 glycosyltransferase family 4 protein [Jiella avicenniae]
MRIAFYAPMKAPDDPVPSGDRLLARNLMAALRLPGHAVTLASRFRSYDRGDRERQERLAAVGARLARRLGRRLADPSLRPDLWFTYHLYHKAPDHVGPAVATTLGIPYVVAEASVANKQRGGPFDAGYRASLTALARADLVLTLNPNDAAGVAPHLDPGVPMETLAPFIDAGPFAAAGAGRAASRAALAARFGLDPERPWLVTAAMMRADQKLASYRLLAEALALVEPDGFELLIAGTGPAEPQVRAAFAEKGVQAAFLGPVLAADMPALLSAADLYVWPAVKEAFGMALIEAGAAGLPVVAGTSPGVAGVVAHGETGLLVPHGDPAAFAGAVRSLRDPARRARYGDAARRRAMARHDVAAAAARLDAVLAETLRRFGRAASTPSTMKRAV